MDSDDARSSGTRGAQVTPDIVGTVIEVLPSALFRVRLDEASRPIVAHIADRIDRNFIRILVGDRVRVEISRSDVSRGRIVEKVL